MAIETFNLLNSLDPNNPTASDGIVGGDDHLRGIKATIKNTFPNITGAVTATHDDLNMLAAGSFLRKGNGDPDAPVYSFTAETTLGLWRSAAGVLSFVGGRLDGNGTVPTGQLGQFLTTAIPTGWYRLNGQAISRTGATAALFAQLGTTYGAGNGSTTFNLPNFESQQLFTRSVNLGGNPGVIQADGIKSHAVTGTATGGSHGHGLTLNVNDPGHAHQVLTLDQPTSNAGGSVSMLNAGANTHTTQPATTGITVSGSADASGSLTMSVAATHAGELETRPINIWVVWAIKA